MNRRVDRERVLGILTLLALIAGAIYLAVQPGFLAYYFAGPGTTPWYERAVWGNVWAAVPCGLLAIAWAAAKLAAHRRAAEERHQELLEAHRRVMESHEHLWKHVAKTYRHATGDDPEPHPQFDR